jgi:transcriptional regulator with XRE-family HTH domain
MVGPAAHRSTRINDIQGLVEAAVAEFAGNQAALALELGVTRATVSRWMSGQSIPDEGSCLRLAKITGRAPADVFHLAGRDTNLLPAELELMVDAELAVRLRRWARRLGVLSMADRATAVSVLDDMVKSLCQRLGAGDLREEGAEIPNADRRRAPSRGALRR